MELIRLSEICQENWKVLRDGEFASLGLCSAQAGLPLLTFCGNLKFLRMALKNPDVSCVMISEELTGKALELDRERGFLAVPNLRIDFFELHNRLCSPGWAKRYAGEDKDPAANRRRVLAELAGLPFEKRTARFRCVVSLIEDGALTVFEGTCEGHIALQESEGVQGFGYDSIFVPIGLDVTLAEISIEEKNALSHRGKAMRMLQCHLQQRHG